MYQKKIGDVQNKNDTDREERVVCSGESGYGNLHKRLLFFFIFFIVVDFVIH